MTTNSASHLELNIGAAADSCCDSVINSSDIVGDEEEYVMTPLPVKHHERAHKPCPAGMRRKQVAACCDYDGVLGSAIAKAVFRIYVLEDGLVAGEAYELKAANASSSESDSSSEPRKPKRSKLSTAAFTALPSSTSSSALAATDPTAITSAPSPQERLEWVQIANVNGHARPLRPYHRHHESLSDADTFCCYFDVTPYSDCSAAAIAVHTHFTPLTERLSGHALAHAIKPFWITVDAPCELLVQEMKDPFVWTKRRSDSNSSSNSARAVKPEPAPVPAHADSTTAVTAASETDSTVSTGASVSATAVVTKSELPLLHPLTSGLFEFRGFTTIAPAPLPPTRQRRQRRRTSPHAQPAKDECFVTLQLLPGGALTGTSRELLRPQSCPLRGTWRADRVKYVLEYTVRGAVGRFEYSGRVAPSSRKLIGKWRNVDDDGETAGFAGGRGDFELALTDAARLSDGANRQRICVLTTGTYTLKGCATDDDGYEYACELFVQLLPTGELRGTTRELVFDQTRAIRGHWTPQTLTYTQVYVVRGDVGVYTYTGALDPASDGAIVCGDWANVEEPDDAATRGERGTFAYGIVRAQRQWSRHSHAQYPPAFRGGVHTVLLCAARTHALPLALWFRVIAFCHESWFASVSASVG